MARSILAIVAGFLLIGALVAGTTALVRTVMPGAFDANGRVDAVGVLLLMQLYVGLYATLGCWLAARLAPSHPMRHALILGVLGFAFNVLGAIQKWDLAPAWYNIAGILLTMLWAWLGGMIRERQVAERASGMAMA